MIYSNFFHAHNVYRINSMVLYANRTVIHREGILHISVVDQMFLYRKMMNCQSTQLLLFLRWNNCHVINRQKGRQS